MKKNIFLIILSDCVFCSFFLVVVYISKNSKKEVKEQEDRFNGYIERRVTPHAGYDEDVLHAGTQHGRPWQRGLHPGA